MTPQEIAVYERLGEVVAYGIPTLEEIVKIYEGALGFPLGDRIEKHAHLKAILDAWNDLETARIEAKQVQQPSGNTPETALPDAGETIGEKMEPTQVTEPDNKNAEIDPNSVFGKISDAVEMMRRDPKQTRELSLAITKGQECMMWLDRDALLNR